MPCKICFVFIKLTNCVETTHECTKSVLFWRTQSCAGRTQLCSEFSTVLISVVYVFSGKVVNKSRAMNPSNVVRAQDRIQVPTTLNTTNSVVQ